MNIQADYEALKEYLTAARGWNTYGLDLITMGGWFIADQGHSTRFVPTDHSMIPMALRYTFSSLRLKQ